MPIHLEHIPSEVRNEYTRRNLFLEYKQTRNVLYRIVDSRVVRNETLGCMVRALQFGSNIHSICNLACAYSVGLPVIDLEISVILLSLRRHEGLCQEIECSTYPMAGTIKYQVGFKTGMFTWRGHGYNIIISIYYAAKIKHVKRLTHSVSGRISCQGEF
jgi:hypothetical protein